MIMIILFVAISFINFCFHMHSLSFYFGPNYVELLTTLEKTIAPPSSHFIDSTLIEFQRRFEGIAMQVPILLPNFHELLVCVMKQFNFLFKPKFTQIEFYLGFSFKFIQETSQTLSMLLLLGPNLRGESSTQSSANSWVSKLSPLSRCVIKKKLPLCCLSLLLSFALNLSDFKNTCKVAVKCPSQDEKGHRTCCAFKDISNIPLFQEGQYYEYKVPSKYNMNFLGVFYICSC